MNKIVYKSKIIKTLIILLAAFFILTLYPLRWWNETATAAIPGHNAQATDPINDANQLTQRFFAQDDHLGSISVYLHEKTVGESFYFRLLDPAGQVMFEETVMLEPEKIPGYYEIMVDLEMKVGERYSFVLQGKGPDLIAENETGAVSQLYVGREWVSPQDYPFIDQMFIADAAVPGWHVVADYNYTVPLRNVGIVIFDGLIILAAVGLLILVNNYYRKNQIKDKLMTVAQALKAIGNPLVAAGVLLGLGAVFFKAFGNYTLDNTFFLISIILLGAILFYGINHNRDGVKPLLTLAILKEKWPDYLQSVMLAGAIAACCEYMCGLYDIHHSIAERKEVIFFALALLVMMKRKELFNPANLIYTLLAGAYGYYFYTQTLTAEMDDLARLNLKLTVAAAVIAGLAAVSVLSNVVNRLLKKEMKTLSWRYGGYVLWFFLLVIFFRNGRWWIVAMAVAFTLYYLQYGAWRKCNILMNICRGIVLQFIAATGYALLHRPFVTFRTVRYPHIFHTVTITATYLTIVECAALVILLSKLQKSRRLRDIWKEGVFFGVVTAYMLFTMARTGFAAVAVTALFAVVLMAVGKGKQKIISVLAAAGIMVSATAVLFPVTFFLQRTIPALVSEPRLFELESFPDEIMRGRQLSSREYMQVGRFIEVFADKVFGIPEGTLDIYGETADYDASHYVVMGAVMDEEQAREWGLVPEQTVAERKIIDAQNDLEDKGWSRGAPIEANTDYSNGRTGIYKAYLDQLNTTGHEEMGAVLPDGSLAFHAHNIYLQFAYDHGLFMGILFIVLMGATFVRGWQYYRQNRGWIGYAALPAVVTAAVAVAGLVEWIFHFSNPSGFILMLMLAPLIFDPPAEAYADEIAAGETGLDKLL